MNICTKKNPSFSHRHGWTSRAAQASVEGEGGMIVIRGVAAPALAGSIVAVVSRQEEAEIGGDVVRCLRCPTTQKQPPPSYFTNVHYNQCWGTPSPAGVQASGSIPPRGGGGGHERWWEERSGNSVAHHVYGKRGGETMPAEGV